MIKNLLAATGLSLVSFGAIAADLPSRVPAAAPILAPPLFSWSGFYVGGNIGLGSKRTAQYYPDQILLFLGGSEGDSGTFVKPNSDSAFVGGLQAGYNYQVGSWVFGVQANVEATGMSGVSTWPDYDSEKITSKVKAFGSFTGRVGFAVQPSLLVYAKGGAAWMGAGYTDIDTSTPYSAKASAIHWGWTVGAGLEYALTSNWSTFIEYSHADYGSKNVTLTNSAQQNSWFYRYSNRIDTVMVGVNYKFGK